MRLSRARSNGPAGSCHMLSSVDCITTTSESEFLVHTGWRNRSWRHSQSTVARYMCRRFGPPSQGWRTFLGNHAQGIAAVDLFVLPTVAFQILYCLVILRHGRRFWMSFGVTSNPTAEWISRQITEAFPWDHEPEYLIRDRDRSYGSVFVRRLCAMGIRDRPIAPRSPWQNAYVERLIGT